MTRPDIDDQEITGTNIDYAHYEQRARRIRAATWRGVFAQLTAALAAIGRPDGNDRDDGQGGMSENRSAVNLSASQQKPAARPDPALAGLRPCTGLE